jgi:ribonuclease P protein subunit RPR2
MPIIHSTKQRFRERGIRMTSGRRAQQVTGDRSRPVRVLVVDDDPLLRTLLRTTFEHAEMSVAEASDAAGAARQVEVEPPDVIILDVNLPGASGLSWAHALRASPRTAGIGIVVLTGAEPAEHDTAAIGATAVLRKPFSPLEVLAAVERAAGLPGGRRLAEAPSARFSDQLLVYADDVRRLLEVERRQRAAIERLYAETLGALANALESRDVGTGAHSARVQRLALELTRIVDGALADEPSVAFGYLLHDVGKIGIPDAILSKPGPLDLEERTIMQTHAPLGAEILAGVGLLAGHGIDVVRHHHERWDGSGYPDRLAGDSIPLPSRIFAVVDAVDAITTSRPYRRAQPWAVAMRELEAGAGTQFDPDVVVAFREREHELRAVSAA